MEKIKQNAWKRLVIEAFEWVYMRARKDVPGPSPHLVEVQKVYSGVKVYYMG